MKNVAKIFFFKRNEAKNLKHNEARRSEFFVSFAKQSENQAKRDAVSLFSLRSEKLKQAKMGHPNLTFLLLNDKSTFLSIDFHEDILISQAL